MKEFCLLYKGFGEAIQDVKDVKAIKAVKRQRDGDATIPESKRRG